jgi:hypothetical protein
VDELQVILHKLSEEEERVKYLTLQLEQLKEERRENVEGEEKVLLEKVSARIILKRFLLNFSEISEFWVPGFRIIRPWNFFHPFFFLTSLNFFLAPSPGTRAGRRERNFEETQAGPAPSRPRAECLV